MPTRCAEKISALIEREKLPASYRNFVEQYWRPLSDNIRQWREAAHKPIVIGVNGAQGSGKSTLCAFLAEALLPECGINAAILSLDDFYLTRNERARLAKEVYPLLATRGVPGTHDVAMITTALAELRAGKTVSVPVFDKASDDRLSTPRQIQGPVGVILFEGWCVGATAQNQEELAEPINTLERDEDKNDAWRTFVNERLETEYRDLFATLDRLIMLRVDSMESVYENRLLQEQKLRAAQPDASNLLSDEQVARFIQHYERLTRHCLSTLPEKADIVVDVTNLGQ